MPKDIPPIHETLRHWHVVTSHKENYSLEGHSIYMAKPDTVQPGSNVAECDNVTCFPLHYTAVSTQQLEKTLHTIADLVAVANPARPFGGIADAAGRSKSPLVLPS